MTIEDSHPLSRMTKCIKKLVQAKVYTTLHAYSRYWQVNIKKRDWPKNAFLCHDRVNQGKMIPFGLINAYRTLQSALDLILSKIKWQTGVVYLDYVVIFSKRVK